MTDVASPGASFPDGFVFGTATSAFQIEGAWNEDGKGPSIWDTVGHTPGKVHLDIPGDVAVDHYHRCREDIALMRDLGVDSHRFSMSWPRILPEGTGSVHRAGSSTTCWRRGSARTSPSTTGICRRRWRIAAAGIIATSRSGCPGVCQCLPRAVRRP